MPRFLRRLAAPRPAGSSPASGSPPHSRPPGPKAGAWRAAALAAVLAIPGPAPGGEPPARVLSMNLCTDQLALLLAAPGQLVSVSALAQDPLYSTMPEAARTLPANHGLAEEIYLLRPDLVLAGRYTAQGTVQMLRRLGVRVEIFDPVTDLDAIGAEMRRMGTLLGREAEAEALAAGLARDLAALPPSAGPRPRAALYSADGFTSGRGSLAGGILDAAGYDNVAEALGIGPAGYLTLEELVIAAPDLVVEGRRLPGASRAEALLDHPALAAVKAQGNGAILSDAEWICGTPAVLEAVRALTRIRAAGAPLPGSGDASRGPAETARGAGARP